MLNMQPCRITYATSGAPKSATYVGYSDCLTYASTVISRVPFITLSCGREIFGIKTSLTCDL